MSYSHQGFDIPVPTALQPTSKAGNFRVSMTKVEIAGGIWVVPINELSSSGDY
jgi:hypothetical protein